MKHWLKNWIKGRSRHFGYSLIIHVLLLVFLLFSVETTFNANQLPAKQGEIIQAVAVDQTKVEAEIKRQQNEASKQKLAEETQQKQLAQKLEQIKKERTQEQAKLEQLKQDMAKAKQAEQEQIKALKLEREKEEKKKEEKAQKEQLAKQAAEAKQKAEQAAKAAEAKKQATLNAAKEAERLAGENQRVNNEVQSILSVWAEKIRSNKREGYGMATDLYCKLSINVLPDGNVQVHLVQSSGNAVYDDLSMKAVYKSQPFPLPEDPAVREQVKSFDLGLKNDESVE